MDLVFVNGLGVKSSLCAYKMSPSAVQLGFLDDFWVRVFVNGFWAILFKQKMSASAVELGFLYEFLGPRVLVFDNDFWGSSSLCWVKISASAVELGF